MNVPRIQEELRKQRLDGWLLFDHHERDPLAYRILGFSPARHVTRRWYYLIPAEGDPVALVHRIESTMLDSLPGDKFTYSSWSQQVEGLEKLLSGKKRVAMQYSPFCQIPYISLVDAGTVELVRRTGVEVVTSAELIQIFEAQLDAAGMESHFEAGRRVDRVRAEAFQLIAERLANGLQIDEFLVKQYVRGRFSEEGLFTDSGPIVGVNRNSGDPHYEPTIEKFSPIKKGDVVLLDMWAKLNTPDAVYYDITWTGFTGSEIPARVQNVFEVVRDARDKAVERVQGAFSAGQTIHGFEVDDATRDHIKSKGYGDYFVHRTGHSIGREVHGNGANMDNLEVHDERKLIPWTCFSVEPGIYLEDFGIRSEINIFIDATTPHVTGAVQRELVQIV
jgi:Xaa-Pro aminopeptidase